MKVYRDAYDASSDAEKASFDGSNILAAARAELKTEPVEPIQKDDKKKGRAKKDKEKKPTSTEPQLIPRCPSCNTTAGHSSRCTATRAVDLKDTEPDG